MSIKKEGLKITHIGEFGFIAHFSPAFIRNLPGDLVGIGDDCAVIPWKAGKKLLVTTDLLIDGVHFLKEKISAADLGYKSLAVNLSDIAAMGGKPLWAFLSMGIPAGTTVVWLDNFFKGWMSLSQKTGVYLLGGDTTRSPQKLVINVTLIGEARDKYIKFRSGARCGDVVAVTGDLGDSEGGLRLILSSKGQAREEKYLVKRHYRPRPHLEEGFFLAQQPEVRAMMDVSDGIDSDLKRIMESSGCGVEVHLENLPVSRALKKCCEKYSWNVDEVAASGGEDYCLLITVEPKKFQALSVKYRRRFARNLQPIGRITAEKGKLVYLKNGRPVSLKKTGFDHFRT
jgi:thiamine-monophosphate kinase